MEQGICLCYQLHPHFLEDISIFPSFLLSISLVVAFKSKDFGWFIDLSIHADETPHLCWQMTHVAIRVAVQSVERACRNYALDSLSVATNPNDWRNRM